jgi:hypothetical protein
MARRLMQSVRGVGCGHVVWDKARFLYAQLGNLKSRCAFFVVPIALLYVLGVCLAWFVCVACCVRLLGLCVLPILAGQQ